MKKIGLFYGSNTGNTERVAEMIKEAFDEIAPGLLEMFDIGLVETSKLLEYDQLIIGCPTWNIGELQDDWDIAYTELDEMDFSSKKIAIFGVGDQFGYPENFCDAIGILGSKFEKQGAELVGFTGIVDYEFSHSLGVEEGVFLGLALDEDSQYEETPQRIANWVALLAQHEFKVTKPVLT